MELPHPGCEQLQSSCLCWERAGGNASVRWVPRTTTSGCKTTPRSCPHNGHSRQLLHAHPSPVYRPPSVIHRPSSTATVQIKQSLALRIAREAKKKRPLPARKEAQRGSTKAGYSRGLWQQHIVHDIIVRNIPWNVRTVGPDDLVAAAGDEGINVVTYEWSTTTITRRGNIADGLLRA